MNLLTVRGLGDDLADRIQSLARHEGTSLNQTVLKILRKGVEFEEASEGANKVGSSLDHLIGAWTRGQADEFDAALEGLEMGNIVKWK